MFSTARGPRPHLLPHPIPALYVTPPSDSPSSAEPSILLASGRRVSRRPDSPDHLWAGWAPRGSRSNTQYAHFVTRPRRTPRQRTPIECDLRAPESIPSISEIMFALFPWLQYLVLLFTVFASSGLGPLPSPATAGEYKRRRPSPVALITLLLSGCLIATASLHAYAFSSGIDLETGASEVGLFMPKRDKFPAPPSEPFSHPELHLWDLL